MRLPKFLPKPKKPSLLLRRVVGVSMLPTFRHGQVVVGNTDTSKVEVGDVVVVEHEGQEKIKRVADVRGDHIYLLGDNPTASSDSRVFGWLESKLVRAKIIWPKRDHSNKKRD